MTPKEILLKAAQRLEDKQDTYSCIALKNVAGYYQDSYEECEMWKVCEFNYFTAFEKFEFLYCPVGKDGMEVWFTGETFMDRQEKRIAALRATAATFD